ncbi:NAD-dependent epimerase/dehydratase family protein [Micromonospora sp. CPCC 206061]|uniref:NAD-dependent epimerase/dehydratase family protein n=1 Tax=Micromonospora sp. CPCC 206061 TaxID=3122410 RepID=UPI002FF05440
MRCDVGADGPHVEVGLGLLRQPPSRSLTSRTRIPRIRRTENPREDLIIGATGMIGSRIVAEALSRGHQVTAASRSGRSEGLPTGPTLTAVALVDELEINDAIRRRITVAY